MAAIRRLAVRRANAPRPRTYDVSKYTSDQNLTKSTMRLVLRIAANQGHDPLVLGALGCGALANPPEDIVQCWLQVPDELKLSGG
ncbi:hypothetical protein F5Y15DRAFT_179548 [Xylariaceae sp. FL0016]|nr:hypothetical protein F5Y15DRAFT_179548 [Xylariaceae sp. FL0016]